ncbi:hypothetical protein ACFL5Q_07130 [Planctomycetota bacterium]
MAEWDFPFDPDPDKGWYLVVGPGGVPIVSEQEGKRCAIFTILREFAEEFVQAFSEKNLTIQQVFPKDHEWLAAVVAKAGITEFWCARGRAEGDTSREEVIEAIRKGECPGYIVTADSTVEKFKELDPSS